MKSNRSKIRNISRYLRQVEKAAADASERNSRTDLRYFNAIAGELKRDLMKLNPQR